MSFLQLRSPRLPASAPTTATNSSTITGQLRVVINPALQAGYIQPVNQPLRNRVPKRQQPNYADCGKFLVTANGTSTLTGQLRVSANPALEPTWVRPTNQPLRSRVPKRLQLPRITKAGFLVTTSSSVTLTGQLRISANPSLEPIWARPVNQPLKSRVPKRLQVNRVIPAQVLTNSVVSTTITGQLRVAANPSIEPLWKQPVNQPLRSRVPKRLQVPRVSKGSFLVTVSSSSTLTGQLRISSNPSLEPVWIRPVNQPLRSRIPKRLQVNRVQRSQFLVTTSAQTTLTGQLRVASNPATQPSWKHLTEQPLRSRVPKRQQPAYPTLRFLVSTVPSTTITGRLRIAPDPSTNPLWKQPTNQPLRSRVPKRLQVPRVTKDKFLVTVSNTSTLTGQLRVSLNPSLSGGWKQPVNEPLRSRVPKRLQVNRVTRDRFLITTSATSTLTGQLRVASNPAVQPTWKQPTNQPLKSRVPKRLQLPRPTKGSFLVTTGGTTTLTGQLRVSANPAIEPLWKLPTEQPLRKRVPKRQQPNYANRGKHLVTVTSSTTLTGRLRVSGNPSNNVTLYKQPVEQPIRKRVPKRQQPFAIVKRFIVSTTGTATITGQLRIRTNPANVPVWKQPTNQPLRKRVPKRLQVNRVPRSGFLVTTTRSTTITGQLRVVAPPTYTPITGTIITGRKPFTERAGNTVEQLPGGAILEPLSTSTKNEGVSATPAKANITTGRKG